MRTGGANETQILRYDGTRTSEDSEEIIYTWGIADVKANREFLTFFMSRKLDGKVFAIMFQ